MAVDDSGVTNATRSTGLESIGPLATTPETPAASPTPASSAPPAPASHTPPSNFSNASFENPDLSDGGEGSFPDGDGETLLARGRGGPVERDPAPTTTDGKQQKPVHGAIDRAMLEAIPSFDHIIHRGRTDAVIWRAENGQRFITVPVFSRAFNQHAPRDTALNRALDGINPLTELFGAGDPDSLVTARNGGDFLDRLEANGALVDKRTGLVTLPLTSEAGSALAAANQAEGLGGKQYVVRDFLRDLPNDIPGVTAFEGGFEAQTSAIINPQAKDAIWALLTALVIGLPHARTTTHQRVQSAIPQTTVRTEQVVTVPTPQQPVYKGTGAPVPGIANPRIPQPPARPVRPLNEGQNTIVPAQGLGGGSPSKPGGNGRVEGGGLGTRTTGNGHGTGGNGAALAERPAATAAGTPTQTPTRPSASTPAAGSPPASGQTAQGSQTFQLDASTIQPTRPPIGNPVPPAPPLNPSILTTPRPIELPTLPAAPTLPETEAAPGDTSDGGGNGIPGAPPLLPPGAEDGTTPTLSPSTPTITFHPQRRPSSTTSLVPAENGDDDNSFFGKPLPFNPTTDETDTGDSGDSGIKAQAQSSGGPEEASPNDSEPETSGANASGQPSPSSDTPNTSLSRKVKALSGDVSQLIEDLKNLDPGADGALDQLSQIATRVASLTDAAIALQQQASALGEDGASTVARLDTIVDSATEIASGLAGIHRADDVQPARNQALSSLSGIARKLQDVSHTIEAGGTLPLSEQARRLSQDAKLLSADIKTTLDGLTSQHTVSDDAASQIDNLSIRTADLQNAVLNVRERLAERGETTGPLVEQLENLENGLLDSAALLASVQPVYRSSSLTAEEVMTYLHQAHTTVTRTAETLQDVEVNTRSERPVAGGHVGEIKRAGLSETGQQIATNLMSNPPTGFENITVGEAITAARIATTPTQEEAFLIGDVNRIHLPDGTVTLSADDTERVLTTFRLAGGQTRPLGDVAQSGLSERGKQIAQNLINNPPEGTGAISSLEALYVARVATNPTPAEREQIGDIEITLRDDGTAAIDDDRALQLITDARTALGDGPRRTLGALPYAGIPIDQLRGSLLGFLKRFDNRGAVTVIGGTGVRNLNGRESEISGLHNPPGRPPNTASNLVPLVEKIVERYDLTNKSEEELKQTVVEIVSVGGGGQYELAKVAAQVINERFGVRAHLTVVATTAGTTGQATPVALITPDTNNLDALYFGQNRQDQPLPAVETLRAAHNNNPDKEAAVPTTPVWEVVIPEDIVVSRPDKAAQFAAEGTADVLAGLYDKAAEEFLRSLEENPGEFESVRAAAEQHAPQTLAFLDRVRSTYFDENGNFNGLATRENIRQFSNDLFEAHQNYGRDPRALLEKIGGAHRFFYEVDALFKGELEAGHGRLVGYGTLLSIEALKLYLLERGVSEEEITSGNLGFELRDLYQQSGIETTGAGLAARGLTKERLTQALQSLAEQGNRWGKTARPDAITTYLTAGGEEDVARRIDILIDRTFGSFPPEADDPEGPEGGPSPTTPGPTGAGPTSPPTQSGDPAPTPPPMTPTSQETDGPQSVSGETSDALEYEGDVIRAVEALIPQLEKLGDELLDSAEEATPRNLSPEEGARILHDAAEKISPVLEETANLTERVIDFNSNAPQIDLLLEMSDILELEQQNLTRAANSASAGDLEAVGIPGLIRGFISRTDNLVDQIYRESAGVITNLPIRETLLHRADVARGLVSEADDPEGPEGGPSPTTPGPTEPPGEQSGPITSQRDYPNIQASMSGAGEPPFDPRAPFLASQSLEQTVEKAERLLGRVDDLIDESDANFALNEIAGGLSEVRAEIKEQADAMQARPGEIAGTRDLHDETLVQLRYLERRLQEEETDLRAAAAQAQSGQESGVSTDDLLTSAGGVLSEVQNGLERISGRIGAPENTPASVPFDTVPQANTAVADTVAKAANDIDETATLLDEIVAETNQNQPDIGTPEFHAQTEAYNQSVEDIIATLQTALTAVSNLSGHDSDEALRIFEKIESARKLGGDFKALIGRLSPASIESGAFQEAATQINDQFYAIQETLNGIADRIGSADASQTDGPATPDT